MTVLLEYECNKHRSQSFDLTHPKFMRFINDAFDNADYFSCQAELEASL